MNGFIIVFYFVLFLFTPSQTNQDSIEGLFGIYIRKFGKTYTQNSTEYRKRFANFKENLKKHKKLNEYHNLLTENGVTPATFGLTQFSDLSPHEFAGQFLLLKPNSINKTTRLKSSFWGFDRKFRIPSDIPKQVDWAFSLVETIESMNQIRGQALEELSVQQVINCAVGDDKCEGGDIQLTADWMIQNKIYLTSESAYPLKDASGTCDVHPSSGIQLASRNAETYFVGREEEMLRLLVKGPLAVAVDAKVWQNYIGGVIQNNCYSNVDHAVQIVGYDVSGPVPFYIVRNSWGESFGDNGYLYIKVGSNLCGIGTEAVAVTLEPV